MENLSELDCVILGVVTKFGPLTPYGVRKHFEGSPTHAFSSSTGSIYPAVRRLESDGHLRSRASARGQQARSLLSITGMGRRALEAWLTPPLDDEAFAVPNDPIRTRLYFLQCLKPAQRRNFLDGVIAGLEQKLPSVRAYADSFPARGKTLVSNLAARGTLRAANAQLRWLREVRRELCGESRARE
jgi:DNA-binding PadR family transcriptional regulator